MSGISKKEIKEPDITIRGRVSLSRIILDLEQIKLELENMVIWDKQGYSSLARNLSTMDLGNTISRLKSVKDCKVTYIE